MAFDSSGSGDASRPPISLHPAFPAVVALWFAALLGLGSMVLPAALIERAVELSGISALVPAASPPLGFMARGLIALASGVAGAVIGIVIAGRVARAHDAERPSRMVKFGKGARRPISVNEELGGEGVVNGFGLPVNRRRALAIAEDERPSDFLYMAPLPGNDDDDHPLPFDQQALAPRAGDEPFELSDPIDVLPDATDDFHHTDPAEAPSMTTPHEFRPDPPAQRAEMRQEFRPAPRDRAGEPLPFAAPSLARRAPDVEPLASAPEPAVPEPYEPAPEPAEPAAQPQSFRGDWSSAPLGELGLVQLVQRLGASLERRREWLASAAATAPVLTPAAGFEPAPAEEAAQAMAAYFGKPAADAPPPVDAGEADDSAGVFSAPAGLTPRPNPLHAWAADDDDDADVMPSFTLPLRKTVSPTIAFGSPAEPAPRAAPENDEGDEDEESYSSLLAMRNPFAPKASGFVRIDEPEPDEGAVAPAVVFPGHGALDSASPTAGAAAPRAFDAPGAPDPGAGSHPAAHADDALRAALATLQRMSGTA